MTEMIDPLEQGRQLGRRGFHFAALELWEQLAAKPSMTPDEIAALHDEWGKTCFQLGERRQALHHFTLAAELAQDDALPVIAGMHSAMALSALSEFDLAQRSFARLVDRAGELPPLFRAQLHGNLAVVQAHNRFHHEAMANTLRSQHFFQEAGVPTYESDLLTNLGLHYEQLGQLDKALCCLKSAARKEQDSHLPSTAELSRLYLVKGDRRQSIRWAEKALDLVWSSFLNYEKEELARLCTTLSNLAFSLGERALALRLIEKAQLLFGQIGMWREWQQTQDIMDAWSAVRTRLATVDTGTVDKLTRFLLLLDAQNAQELIHPHFSALLDARVHYAAALSAALDFDREQYENLVYACRFCDYGLTAVEPDVILNPARSPSAWQRFAQHPSLSVFMLESHAVLPQIHTIILDHHEHYDGSGFPAGKRAQDIDTTALVLAVSDLYTTKVVMESLPHSQAIATLQAEAGRWLDPDLVDKFIRLFASAVS